MFFFLLQEGHLELFYVFSCYKRAISSFLMFSLITRRPSRAFLCFLLLQKGHLELSYVFSCYKKAISSFLMFSIVTRRPSPAFLCFLLLQEGHLQLSYVSFLILSLAALSISLVFSLTCTHFKHVVSHILTSVQNSLKIHLPLANWFPYRKSLCFFIF